MTGTLIVAIDPGATTGVAALEMPAKLLLAEQTTVRSEVVAWVRYHKPEVLVVEEFRPYEGLPAWAELPAPKLIGVLEELGFKMVMQPPGIKKQMPDDLLRAAGMYSPGKPHANDAVRHALYYAWLQCKNVTDDAVQEVYRKYLREKREKQARIRALAGVGPARPHKKEE